MSVPPRPPPRSARRRPWQQVDLAALDFEATGLDLARDTIISFGVVPIAHGGIDVGRSVYQLVHPGEVVPSRSSVVVHGLRPIDLVDAPTIEESLDTLAAALAGRFLVTWWAPVESGFLSKMFGGRAQTWMHRAVDVRDMLIALEGSPGAGLSLSQAAERYEVPVASPHNALDDALVTAQLFLVLATKLSARARSIQELKNLRPRPRPRFATAEGEPP